MLLSGADAKADTIGASSVTSVQASVTALELSSELSLSGKRHAVSKQRTLLLLCFVGFIEGADMQLLPATFSALEEDLGLSPTRLGHMSLAQSLFMATSSPFWGALADRRSRKQLLVFSCVAWAVVTILLAMAASTQVMLFLRCVHGAALSSLGPVGQSVVADITEPHQRGAAYGWMYTAIALGSILSSLVGTSFANHRISSGVRGWRLVFGFVAVLSLWAGAVIHHGMDEPPRERLAEPEVMTTHASGCRASVAFCGDELKRALRLARIPTFTVIVLQGVFGCIPWNAMGFMAMYLHYCGHGDAAAAMVVSGLLMGRAVGGVLGGSIGDALARRSPAHGRPLTAQISVLLGIPFTAMLVLSAPSQPAGCLTVLSLLLGAVASWCSAGVNRPILAEVVGPSGRASIIAWMVAIEGSSGALFGAPVVGWLAEQVFGYHKAPVVTADAHLSDDLRATNVKALSQAMLWGTVPAWVACALLFSMLHWTYGPDARYARHTYERVVDVSTLDGEAKRPASPGGRDDCRAPSLRRSGAVSTSAAAAAADSDRIGRELKA